LAIITSLRCIVNDIFSTNNEEVGSIHSEEFSDEEEADETNGNYLSRYTNEERGVFGTYDRIFQCCGSGSGIRCLFDPWIRDRFFPDPGSQDHIFKSFLTIFLVKSSIIL
jgi:hypothetical protein